MMPCLWSVMKARPSLWNLRPLGSPSYSKATDSVPSSVILKSRPHGMSVTQRLPSRSKDGPSRKDGVGAPFCSTSTQCDLRLARDSESGTRAKTVVSITGGGANMAGLSSLWLGASLGRLALGAHEIHLPRGEIREVATQPLEREAQPEDAPHPVVRPVP